jgi:hypothetical protein
MKKGGCCRSVKEAREVEVVELPLPIPAEVGRDNSSIDVEAALPEEINEFTPEVLESTLSAAFQDEADDSPINPHTGIIVDGRTISFTELLLGNDFDLDNVKFTPGYIGNSIQPAVAPPRMGPGDDGDFDVDDIMGLSVL